MLSYKMDFSSCVIMPGFGKSSHKCVTVSDGSPSPMYSHVYSTLIEYSYCLEVFRSILLYRSAMKATVVLLPLLGVTWVFGLLAVNRNLSIFAWIFTVLNSLQVC